jgi:hypothetical protein
VQIGVGELGRTTRIKLSGQLVDVAAKRTIWRDTAEGDADLAGLLAVLSGPSSDYEAAYDAARTLFSTLPDRSRHRGAESPSTAPAALEAPIGSMRPSREQ